LASAFRLKAPLPPYLPPAERARQQLVSILLSFSHPNAEHNTIKRSKRSEDWMLCGSERSRDRGNFYISLMR
jgi:hypothetical protein